MDLSIVILISGGAAVILGLIFCFFGYKLGRLLLPFCGLLIVEGLVYIFVYKQMQFDMLGTWLLFGGSGVAVYIILFFIKRMAAFFTGLIAGALLVLYIVDVLKLQSFEYIVPAAVSVCIVSGLLAAVYKKAGVIVFTALFGACIAAFAGIYIYVQGADASAFSAAGLFAVLGSFLSTNAVFIAGASAGVTISGILIQSALTSSNCVLEGKTDESGPEKPEKSEKTERPAKPGKKEVKAPVSQQKKGQASGTSSGYFNI